MTERPEKEIASLWDMIHDWQSKCDQAEAELTAIRAENERLEAIIASPLLVTGEKIEKLCAENERLTRALEDHILQGDNPRFIELKLLRKVAEAAEPAMEIIEQAFANYGWVMNLRIALKAWRGNEK